MAGLSRPDSDNGNDGWVGLGLRRIRRACWTGRHGGPKAVRNEILSCESGISIGKIYDIDEFH